MAEAVAKVAPAKYVTVELAATITGLSVDSIRRRISTGVWLEGREYRKSADNRVWINMEGFYKWVEQTA